MINLARVHPTSFSLRNAQDSFYANMPRLAASWISASTIRTEEETVMEFSLVFQQAEEETVIIHATADQYYRLSLDGEDAVTGRDSNSPENWLFESYELRLLPGNHELRALVWHYGKLSPMNRNSLAPGFWLASEAKPELFNTGTAAWTVRRVSDRRFLSLWLDASAWMSIPPYEEFRPEGGGDDAPSAPVAIEPGWDGRMCRLHDRHCLVPSQTKSLDGEWRLSARTLFCDERTCGEALDEAGFSDDFIAVMNDALNHRPIVFPPHSRKRIVLELDDYCCAFAKLDFSEGKGAEIRISWCEAAFSHPKKHEKGSRRLQPGQYFRGSWDRVVADGRKRSWSPLAWRCGRFVELRITCANEPLTLERFLLRERRYPLTMEGAFSCNDPKIDALVPFCFRTLQLNTHDSFVDCPYYERLLYAGDGRLEALTCLTTCRDDIPVRDAISSLALSRDIDGMLMARWPSATRQRIPSFALWWIGMLYDYARWRGDLDFVKAHLPAMRNLLDLFLGRCGPDCFLRGLPWEWNFIDWVDEWQSPNGGGTPPGIMEGVNATYNWLFVYALGLAEQLELFAGEEILAQRWRKIALRQTHCLQREFWNEARGLFQEDASGVSYSVHAQVLALLTGRLSNEIAARLGEALESPELTPPSIFFRHYLFEAFAKLSTPERILSGMGLWNSFLDKGFKTVPETPENKLFNQRSDCHGWGAHPLYHLISGIAGITPEGMGFQRVRIEPRPGELTELKAKCIHPKGTVRLDYKKAKGERIFIVELPDQVTGTLFVAGQEFELAPGSQEFALT